MKKLSLLFAALGITVAMHAQLTASFTVTDNDPAFIFNNTSQGTGTFSWSFGDGNTSAQNSPAHTYTYNGQYTVRLIMTGAGESDTMLQTLTVNNAAPCTPAIQVQDNGGTGNYTFTTNSLPGASSYYWEYDDGMHGYGQSVTHNFSLPGTYDVCITTVGNVAGCGGTQCTSLVVTNGWFCTANFSYAPTGVANEMSFSSLMFSYPGGPYVYAWDFGDGATSAAGTPTHAYSSYGKYEVCLTVQAMGRTDHYCDTVTVANMCDPAFTISDLNAPDYSFILASSDTTGLTFHWDFGDGNSSTSANPAHTYSTPGTYQVQLTVSGNGCTDSLSQTIEYNPASAACGAFFQWYEGNTPNALIIADSSWGSGPLSYAWDFGDGSSSTVQYPTHTYTGSGPYTLCLTISDSVCTATYCDTLLSSGNGGFTVEVISEGELGLHAQAADFSLHLYPNPASGQLNYATAYPDILHIEIYDMRGVRVFNKLLPGTGSIGTANLQNGLYFFVMKEQNGNVLKKEKLVILR
ncbi:MAG: PKD domain-containing protein [Flavobacteriales bacterium]